VRSTVGGCQLGCSNWISDGCLCSVTSWLSAASLSPRMWVVSSRGGGARSNNTSLCSCTPIASSGEASCRLIHCGRAWDICQPIERCGAHHACMLSASAVCNHACWLTQPPMQATISSSAVSHGHRRTEGAASGGAVANTGCGVIGVVVGVGMMAGSSVGALCWSEGSKSVSAGSGEVVK